MRPRLIQQKKEADERSPSLRHVGKQSRLAPQTRLSLTEQPPRHQRVNRASNDGSNDTSSPHATKLEPSEDLKITACGPQHRLRSTSPPTWNANVRKRKLREDGFVEVPKVLIEHEETKKLLRIQKKYVRAQERKEKGKFPEKTSVNVGRVRKTEQTARGNTSFTNPPIHESENPQHALTAPNPIHFLSTQSKQTETKSADLGGDRHPRFPIFAAHKDQTTFGSIEKHDWESANSSSLDLRKASRGDTRSHFHAHEASRHSQDDRKQFPITNDKPQAFLDRQKPCTCVQLPAYFARARYTMPNPSTWPGSRSEFLERIKQMSTCYGHTDRVKRQCQSFLRREHCSSPFNHYVAPSSTEASKQDIVSNSQPFRVTTSSQFHIPTSYQKSPSKQRSKLNSRMNKRDQPVGHKLTAQTHDTHELYLPASSYHKSGTNNGSTESHFRKQPTNINHGQPSMNPPTLPVKIRDNGLNSSPSGYCAQTYDHNDFWQGSKTNSSREGPPLVSDVTKKRYHSMPAFSKRPIPNASDDASEHPSRGRLQRDSMLPPIPGDISVIQKKLDELKQTVEGMRRLMTGAPGRILCQNPEAPGSPAEADPVPSQPLKKKRKTVAEERAAGKPALNRNVPMHLRQSDDMLIAIGKEINGYERHRRAPEAFSWHGRLYSEFDHLLAKFDEHGDLVWDAKVIARLKRSGR